MRDVMLDLETVGTSPDAAIIAIGAVVFDPETGEIGQTFLQAVSLESAVKEGGKMDVSTVLWWMGQSDEAKAVFTDKNQVTIEEALSDFDDFINAYVEGGSDRARIWGNGSDFDNVLLGTAYDRLRMERPWKFFNNRCYRTAKSLNPSIKMERVGTFHNALDDAMSQAKHLIAIMKASATKA